MAMHKVQLNLSKPQMKRLINGHKIRLDKKALSGGSLWLNLHPMHAARIEQARMSGKGTTLQLSREEVDGSGIKEFFQKAIKGIKKVAGPLIKQGVSKLIDVGSSALEGFAPEAIPLIEVAKGQFKDKLVNKLGKITGLYDGGALLIDGKMRSIARSSRSAHGGMLSEDQSHLLNSLHPAYHPALNRGYGEMSYPEVVRVWCPHCENEYPLPLDTAILGGSFRGPGARAGP